MSAVPVPVKERILSSQSKRCGPPNSGFKRVRRGRSNNNLVRKLYRIAAVASVIIALACIAIYAAVTALGYHNVELSSLCRIQEIENERLRVAITRCSSPEQIAAAAEKTGMIWATNYEYLQPPQSVASAR